MRALTVSLALVLGLSFAERADAGTYTFKRPQLTLTVPDDWSTQERGDTVTFVSKDQALAVNLAFAGGDVDKAWDKLVAQVSEVVGGFAVQKQSGIVAKMYGYVGNGAGTFQGVDVECLLAALQTRRGDAITVFALGVAGQYEQHDAEMKALLASMAVMGYDGLAFDAGDGVAPALQKFAARVVKAVHYDDAKAFLKLIGKKGLSRADGEKSVYVKAAKLKKAFKQAGGVSAYLGMTEGDWHYRVEAEDGSLSIYRGDGTGVVTYLSIQQVKGKWTVIGTYLEDHGGEDDGAAE